MNLMMVMMSCEIRQHECKHLPKKRNMSRTSWPSGPKESFASVCCVCFSRLYWPDNLAPIRISKLCSQNKSVLSLDSCETTRDNMRFAWMNVALVRMIHRVIMRSFVTLFALQRVVYLEFGRRVCVAALDRSTQNLVFVCFCCKGPNVGSYGIALKACTQGHWASSCNHSSELTFNLIDAFCVSLYKYGVSLCKY